MKIDNNTLLGMSAEDFLPHLFKKIKIRMNKEIKIGDKSGNEFYGYISKIYLTAFPPHKPLHIRFIDENISPTINRHIADTLATGINIFYIDFLELLE